MPLVVLVGHPCSGKTTRAQALATHLHQLLFDSASSTSTTTRLPSPIREIILINHESLCLPRAVMYGSASQEKAGLSSIRASVERHLTSSHIVIVDHLNNIKGYRYELHCRARESGTTYCVIYCDTPAQQCEEFNQQRTDDKYSHPVLNDLIQRMEAPNESKRWDSPLFTVKPNDPLPVNEISEWLLNGKRINPGLSTLPNKLDDVEYLTQLDRTVSNLVNTIVQQQRQQHLHAIGDSLVLPYTSTRLLLTRSISLAELKRIQSQFIKMAKLRPIQGDTDIATSFVQHLQNCINI